ncbi:Brefeldin A resistance protein [Mycena venus]|uniref:Brefeldin A resistance protein n=1 Tax=Mycena venus TaxID=2733690 RepID=A0A8H7D298_9AGAR|nr:Brefeldin A resistance protein [Mycena venus]
MSDAHNTPPSTNHIRDSPPASPPSPANSDTDTKLSRKREREVSLEPATTPKSTTDTDPLLRDARTPAKKNRLHLDSTAEEEDGVMTRSRSRSPSPGLDVDVDGDLSVSPPQEMKIRVRQISQGVEDLSWQNMKNASPEKPVSQLGDSDPVESADADGSTEIKVDAEEPSSSDGALDIPATEDVSAVSAGLSSQRDSDSDSGEKEKGLKRKFLERGSSAGPPENGDESKAPAEPLKRLRDDPDKDENPRETKRPSPPPEKSAAKSAPSETAPPKLGGFMAYASTSSPFAAVKGQNLFASKKATSPVPFGTTTVTSGTSSPFATSRTASPFAAALGEPLFPTLVNKTRGFWLIVVALRRVDQSQTGRPRIYVQTWASKVTPSTSEPCGWQQRILCTRVRSGSPDDSGASSVERATPVGSAFTGNGSAPDSGAEDERDDRPISFGEKLRAGKDEEEEGKSDEESAKPVLTEQEFMTGEEDEETLHQVRGKLFSLDVAQWKERGTGTLKLNVRRSDGGGARLVMRKEAVYTVLLNVTLFHGMRCTLAQDPRYIRLSVLEGGVATHYNLRVASAKAAQELLNEINANIPAA